MAAWTKRIALYIDVDSAGSSPLLSGKSSSRLSSKPVFIQGDTVRLELWFRSLSTSPLNASTVVEIPAGSALAVAAKESTDLDAKTVLFSASGFAQDGSGDDLCYYAALNLNTQEIDALFDEETGSLLDIKVDVELQNADNSDRLTFQFDASLKQQVYDGEPATTPGTPPYYNAAEVEARFVPQAGDNAWSRWHDNGDGHRWWHYDLVTQLWYPEVMVTRDGVRSMALGEEGISL
jgi:hypothetical protein